MPKPTRPAGGKPARNLPKGGVRKGHKKGFGKSASKNDSREKIGKSVRDAISNDADSTRSANETAKHVEELKKLEESQKEFFDFLAAEDASLLKFGLSDEEEPEDDDLDGDEEQESEQDDLEEPGSDDMDAESEENGEDSEPKTARPPKKKASELTSQLLKQWCKTALQNPPTPASFNAMKKLVWAFKSAAHINSDEENLRVKYTITSANVFNDVVVFVVQNIGTIWDTYLKRDKSADSKTPFLPNKFPRWNKMRPYVNIYLLAVLKMLETLVEPKMFVFLLRHMEECAHYFGPYPTVSKKYLKICGRRLRNLFVFKLSYASAHLRSNFPSRSSGAYLTYVRSAKFTTPQSEPTLQFMENCVVELYTYDVNLSYQHAFVYIRQLAIHLRQAYASAKTKTSHESVYNWQTLKSLKVWATLLATMPTDPQIWLLAYPLIQVIQGVILLTPTARHFPLRFHCLRMLQTIADASKLSTSPMFLNSAAFLLDVLDTQSMKRKPRAFSGKPPSFKSMLHVPQNLLGTHTYHSILVRQTVLLLSQYFATYARSIAFPELAYPTIVALRRFGKECRNTELTSKIRPLIEKLRAHSRIVEAHRLAVNIAPTDSSSAFLTQETHPKPLPIEIFAREQADAAKKQEDNIVSRDGRRSSNEVPSESEEDMDDDEMPQDDASNEEEPSDSMDDVDTEEPEEKEGVVPFDMDMFGGNESDEQDDEEDSD